MNEIWKDIEGYEGKYQVSSFGRVRSVDHQRAVVPTNTVCTVKGKIIKPAKIGNGYMGVKLCNGSHRSTASVHRLVAKAFVPGYFDGAHVNHIDENKANNRADNLEWVTPSANNLHGSHPVRVAQSKFKQISQYTKDGQFVKTYPSITEACRATGATPSLISRVVGTQYKAKGYLWRFAE